MSCWAGWIGRPSWRSFRSLPDRPVPAPDVEPEQSGHHRRLRRHAHIAAPNTAITSMAEKRIFVIAGPNGAGKTTFATEFLPNEARCPVFVNADLIAAGLSPFRPEQVALAAARVMLRRIHEHAARGESFAFETTLSGRGYAGSIPRWQRRGYRITLFFLRLPTPETAIARVRQRVLEGGHDVPDAVIPPALPCRLAQLGTHLPGPRGRVGRLRQLRTHACASGGERPVMNTPDRSTCRAPTPRSPVLAGAQAAMHRRLARPATPPGGDRPSAEGPSRLRTDGRTRDHDGSHDRGHRVHG